MSCLLGVRNTHCAGLKTLSWTRKFQGTYPQGKAKTKMNAYNRLLVVRIALRNNVGGIGKDLRVAVCHLHFQVANKNKGFKKQHQEFWSMLANEMRYHGVHVLMGDFNMSLFRVVPELRSHGIQATLVSWFPWRAEDTDEIMVDSCGIFTLVPAETMPSVPPEIWDKAIYEKLPAIQKNGGPGQTIETYLPKQGDGLKKLKDSLEPLPMTIEEEDETEPAAVAGSTKDVIKMKGKPLKLNVWMYRGKPQGISFPTGVLDPESGAPRRSRLYPKRGQKKVEEQDEIQS